MPENYTNDLPLPRQNQDTVVITNGHILLNFCKTTCMRLINGRVGNDNIFGTFVNSRGSTAIDFVLIMQGTLFKKFDVSEYFI